MAPLVSCTRPHKMLIIAIASIFLQLPTSKCWKIGITLYDDLVASRTYVERIPRDPVSEKDREIFQLSDDNLRNAIKATFDEFPDDIFLTSPTPWNLYETFNWSQVERIVFVKPKILTITDASVNVPEKSIPDLRSSFTAYWKKSDNESERIDYAFEMDIEITPLLKYHPHITWNTKWGEATIANSDSEERSFGTDGLVKPGRTIKAKKRTVNMQVDFNACVRGYVAVNYSGKNSGHHFRAVRVTDILEQRLQLNSSFHNSQIITIVYYIVPHSSMWSMVSQNGVR